MQNISEKTASFTLTVNGKPYTVEVPGEMPLLWALRDVAGLTGTKYGCGLGLCGTCTVHVDGKAVRSCIATVAEVGEKEIITIEGLSEDGSHPLQIAWQELDVAQCGYCQAGQIMNAAAWLRKNPRPTAKEIDAQQSNNLCRCGTYTRIRDAILRAAEMGGG